MTKGSSQSDASPAAVAVLVRSPVGVNVTVNVSVFFHQEEQHPDQEKQQSQDAQRYCPSRSVLMPDGHRPWLSDQSVPGGQSA
jgi:hypothetical protein